MIDPQNYFLGSIEHSWASEPQTRLKLWVSRSVVVYVSFVSWSQKPRESEGQRKYSFAFFSNLYSDTFLSAVSWSRLRQKSAKIRNVLKVSSWHPGWRFRSEMNFLDLLWSNSGENFLSLDVYSSEIKSITGFMKRKLEK